MIYLPSIIEELMSCGYPEIRLVKMGFGYERLKTIHAGSYRNNGGWEILIDSRLERSKRSVVRGITSHELSHVLKDRKLNKSAWRKYKRLYKTRLYRELKEKDTDLDVIIRGHGEDLLSYKMFEVSTGHEVTGLSVYETKKLIRQSK